MERAMRTHQSGFTLIELMLVTVIAAVMLGIGIPSFREFTASQAVKNTSFDLAAALLLARSEAIKRNTPVTITMSGADWSGGWTVTSGGTTLSTKDAASKVTITPIPDTTTAIAYQGTGRIPSTLRFQIGGANTTAVRCVTITTSGVPNTTTASCT
jgi:type IV fimbrial biogenesis protein FimT